MLNKPLVKVMKISPTWALQAYWIPKITAFSTLEEEVWIAIREQERAVADD